MRAGGAADVGDADIELLLQAIYEDHGYDFRHYVRAPLERRLRHALRKLDAADLPTLQSRLSRDSTILGGLLDAMTVGASEMFRDPAYFLALRSYAAPLLREHASSKVWVAGCSTGEEVYSLCILLHEEELLDRTVVYATDINPAALDRASRGVFPLAPMRTHTRNYQRAGGRRAFSDYYTVAYDSVRFDRRLLKNVVFSDHNLAGDGVFAEVQLVSCRNVLIYFDGELQDRVIGLAHDSLSAGGLLGLGAREGLRFSAHADAFEPIAAEERLFRRRTPGPTTAGGDRWS